MADDQHSLGYEGGKEPEKSEKKEAYADTEGVKKLGESM